jgi:phospholipid/cholesterol/gamma-HCH transport system permease protein
MNFITNLGFNTRKNVAQTIQSLGKITRLGAKLLFDIRVFKRIQLILQQIHFVGNYSLLIILISGLFVGFVLGLQGYKILTTYGSEQLLGTMVALALVQQLGPVVTALLFAGRAGTALTAEIGLMKSGEQLLAMEMMAIDPLLRILSPRFWAGVIAMPILSMMFSSIGVFGGYLVGVQLLGVDEGAFWSIMQNSVDFQSDIMNGIFKSMVFGVIVTLIALYQGYETEPTPEGVARATTRTVVYSSLTVLFFNMVMTAMSL